MTTIIPLHKRAVWQRTLNSTYAVASIVGEVIGGGLTQNVTWRWSSYINIPIGAFSVAVVVLFLDARPAWTGNAPLV